jgi:hypothetical protein
MIQMLPMSTVLLKVASRATSVKRWEDASERIEAWA